MKKLINSSFSLYITWVLCYTFNSQGRSDFDEPCRKKVLSTKLSDQIENIIHDMLEATGGTAKIRRNELANTLGCVPSQINYVIHTRFNGKSGYIVESRRGGGGGILIKRVDQPKGAYIERIMTEDSLSQQDISVLLSNLMNNDIVNQREMQLIKIATSDKFLPDSQPQKNFMRALLFKDLLTILY